MALTKAQASRLDSLKEAHSAATPYSLPEGASRKGQNFRKLNVHDLVFPDQGSAINERIDSALSEIIGLFTLSDIEILLTNAVINYCQHRKDLQAIAAKEKQDQARELIASLKAQGFTDEQILALGNNPRVPEIDVSIE